MNCELCDSFFEPSRRTQIYCSEKCRKIMENRSYRLRRRQKVLEERRKYNPCEWCEENHMRNGRFCSSLCVKQQSNYSKYGLRSKAEWLAMHERAAGCCEICGEEFGKRTPLIDYCRKTGKPRGLLCVTCSLGLGKFRNDVALLNRASGYLSQKMS